MNGKNRSKSRTQRPRTRPANTATTAVTGMSGEAPGEPATGGVEPSYFHGQPISSELIRAFVAAAVAFRKQEPWKTFDAEQFLDVRVPALGIDDAAVSVITDEGYGGLQIDLDHELLAAVRAGTEADAAGRGMLGVMFYGRQQLPPRLREEARRLPFMPATGPIPALLALDGEVRGRALTQADYVAATAILEAVTRFVAEVNAAYELEWSSDEEVDVPDRGEYDVACDGTTVSVAVQYEAPPEPPRAALVGEGPRPPPGAVHRLRVTLRDTRPPIWRRLVVPSTLTLAQLHAVVQIAFGWEDDRDHMFNRKGQDIGPVDSDAQFDEASTELWAVAPAARDVLRYTYGYRSDWIHDIEVEAVEVAEETQARPRCVDGRRAGPPEQCRGPWALEMLIRGGRLAGEDVTYEPAEFLRAEIDESLAEAFADG